METRRGQPYDGADTIWTDPATLRAVLAGSRKWSDTSPTARLTIPGDGTAPAAS
ncbi:hypothetical protein [Nonomuraea dietziae]|uniref:hypothetical protein n=1 Tax=Nonomuraea dietziae TaxID=65515 RepID=UPI0031D37EB0